MDITDVEKRELQREETMVELEQERRDEGILLHAGVCLRVPFNRVVVNRARRDTSGHVDIAGVSSVMSLREGGGEGGSGSNQNVLNHMIVYSNV